MNKKQSKIRQPVKKNKLKDADWQALTKQKSPEDEYNFSDWIELVRNYLNLTQAELARRAKISQPHVAKIESGRTDPRISTLEKVFAALECKIVLRPIPVKTKPRK